MGLFSKNVILTPHERSEQVTNVFLGAMKDFKEINNDIELEQEQIKAEIEERHARHGELEVLKTKNNKFVSKLSIFFEVEE